jgi:NAD(P)-dependent dehydrogenase (short-subunit alcohol dehydrogenase family)
VFNAGAFGDPAPRRAIIQNATEEFGCLGILIDDAALQTMRRSLEEMDEQWTDTSGDNLRSRYLLRNAALPHTKSVSAVVSTTSAPQTRYRPSSSLDWQASIARHGLQQERSPRQDASADIGQLPFGGVTGSVLSNRVRRHLHTVPLLLS